MKYLPPFAIMLVAAALAVNAAARVQSTTVTAVPLSERQSIAVWCALHDRDLTFCVESNTP